MRDMKHTRYYDPRDAHDMRNQLSPPNPLRGASWKWAMTTADERRNRALSEEFNRSRPRDFRPILAGLFNLLGLIMVVIGGGVLLAFLGGPEAILAFGKQALQTVETQVTRVDLNDIQSWGPYAGAGVLGLWILYLGRRLLYLLGVALLVGLFALGVVGSMTLAHQYATRVIEAP